MHQIDAAALGTLQVVESASTSLCVHQTRAVSHAAPPAPATPHRLNTPSRDGTPCTTRSAAVSKYSSTR